jgi:hypothetical protein
MREYAGGYAGYVATTQSALGATLGRLVAAESHLKRLDLRYCRLGDAALRPLFEAVAGNRMLRMLNYADRDISRECARDIILPAVRANASLRELQFSRPDIPDLTEAEQLVAARV